MLTEEQKQYLYNQNPTAYFLYIKNRNLYYTTTVEIWGGVFENVQIEIPLEEISETIEFYPQIDANILMRWVK